MNGQEQLGVHQEQYYRSISITQRELALTFFIKQSRVKEQSFTFHIHVISPTRETSAPASRSAFLNGLLDLTDAGVPAYALFTWLIRPPVSSTFLSVQISH
jgi:hypothetical protein